MSLTIIIIVNAALGAAIVYGLHHLLAHGIRTGRSDHRAAVTEIRAPESQRRAA